MTFLSRSSGGESTRCCFVKDSPRSSQACAMEVDLQWRLRNGGCSQANAPKEPMCCGSSSIGKNPRDRRLPSSRGSWSQAMQSGLSGQETSWTPQCGKSRGGDPGTKLPATVDKSTHSRGTLHPQPFRSSLTLVGDMTAVACPSCQQGQEETKLQKKFPDFAAPHGSRWLSSPP